MEIYVLLKQVPATDSQIRIADDGVSIRTDDLRLVINPYDEFAIEEALQLKAIHEGTVTVISVGTDKTQEAIRSALAMGADKGIQIEDPALAGCDALTTAKVIAATLQPLSFDLVIAGHRAVDDDNFQVGPAVAEYLDIPHIPFVIQETVADGKITCHRTIDGGTIVLESSLPALLTTQRGLNEPRLPSLPGIMKAKSKPLEVKGLADIGLDAETLGEPLTRILSLNLPPERKAGRIIEGESPEEKAVALVEALHGEARVI
ncbi:MAG: electron transfer flavoprotein subunit beta/FixA family protein [Desulfobacterales bacterium]